MERLTKYDYLDGIKTGDLKAGIDERKAFDRLAAYEDTGLEPREIDCILDAYGRGHTMRTENAERLTVIKNITTDHLRELVQAEKDGRLLVLPCKVGDTVYRVLITRDCPPVLSEAKIETVGQAADLIGRIGKHKLLSYYLTREEAEAALSRKEKGGNQNEKIHKRRI